MEDKIKVGEYVRINKDYRILAVGIGKVKRIVIDKKYVYVEMKEETLQGLPMQIDIKNIVNHSKDIIDLIEVGDYVNGHLVYRIDNNTTIWIETETNLYCGIYESDIKTIVTKEQFKAMEYKI